MPLRTSAEVISGFFWDKVALQCSSFTNNLTFHFSDAHAGMTWNFLKKGEKRKKENIKGFKDFSYLGILVNLLPWLIVRKTNKLHIIVIFVRV